MSKKKIQTAESILEDMIMQARMEDDTPTSALVDSTASYLESWMEDNPWSFKNIEMLGPSPLSVTNVVGEHFRAYLEYPDEVVDVHFDSLSSGKSSSETKLFVCSKTLKSMETIVGGFRSFHNITEKQQQESDDEDSLEESDTSEFKTVNLKPETLVIYGNNLDTEDKFSSRLDKELAELFPDDLSADSKFRTVELSGAFSSVDDMRDTIMLLYKRLTPCDYMSGLVIHMDSRVLDDDGEQRTLASLVASGYIEQTVVRVPNVVRFDYKKLDKRLSAKIYEGEYKPKKRKKVLPETTSVDLLYG